MSKHILSVVNMSNAAAYSAAEELHSICQEKDIKVTVIGSWDLEDPNSDIKCGDYDLAVVFGGDGTMLRTAHHIGNKPIPILGINYGHLGFLTNTKKHNLSKFVDLALKGRLIEEHRSHLNIKVYTDKGQFSYVAMNEVCVRRAVSSKIVTFSININKDFVCSMKSDGVIGASATGSTAYSLAAGGPLASPSFKGAIIVPLAPHTLTSRPIVTDAKDVCVFDFTSDNSQETLAVYIDGISYNNLGSIQKVELKPDKRQTTFLRDSHESFYKRLSKVFF